MNDYLFDYSRVDWQFVSNILNSNSIALSRTRHGISDISSSLLKKRLLLVGEELQKKSAENEVSVHSYIFKIRNASPACANNIFSILSEIADLTNSGLLPRGRWREWSLDDIDTPINPLNIEGLVLDFCNIIYNRWSELFVDPIPLVAWAEWELNGGLLHPFYDGCGRISRSFSALLLLHSSTLLPLYNDRDIYYSQGNTGIESFSEYIRERIKMHQTLIQAY